MEKKVLMVGSYKLEEYSRGRILYKGLIKNNVETEMFLHKNYFSLIKRLMKVDFDVVIVNGKFNLVFSWIMKIIHKKKIIFDMFISDYDNLVNDRKLVKKNSLKAKLIWLGDKYSCSIADKILLETLEHIKYFAREFKADKKKFSSIVIGADEDIFYPIKVEEKKEFIVSFHGTFIPLQGIEYIVKAAKILEKKDVFFEIIGKGQTYEEIQKLVKKLNIKNIKFLGFKKIDSLPKHIARGDVCLGIFGNTEKTQKVIPNKAYEIIAMKKPLITSDTPAVRELFTHKKNCYLCMPADEKSLAKAILILKDNKELRNKISEKGYELFLNKCNSVAIGKVLVKIL
jgi:glycosyltransferase involved in cell wall biosynthesis